MDGTASKNSPPYNKLTSLHDCTTIKFGTYVETKFLPTIGHNPSVIQPSVVERYGLGEG